MTDNPVITARIWAAAHANSDTQRAFILKGEHDGMPSMKALVEALKCLSTQVELGGTNDTGDN